MKDFLKPKMQEKILTGKMKGITDEDIARAETIRAKYKSGKANLEQRIIDDENWWKMRHWDSTAHPDKPNSASAWLFNAIMNKHADAMDNYPEPVVLPREISDKESAKVLSEILPVVFEQNDFVRVYSTAWWDKLKHGTSVYGIFWDAQKENGLGDIAIRDIDLLKIFWEPGVTDIQQSQNLFVVELYDLDVLRSAYPDKEINCGGNVTNIEQYQSDDTVDNSNKAEVVDWYYKRRTASGKTVVHLCKYVGNTVLYASENDETYAQTGFYAHGEYPVVFDTMFPEKTSPCGFGYVKLCKDPQIYIDKLQNNILEHSLMGSKVRYFKREASSINDKQFADFTNSFVDVAGSIDDQNLKPIQVPSLDPVYLNVLQFKVEEMKDTAGNRDVNSGGVGSGVTAASAIAALQEAGNKASRDMINASYQAFCEICKQTIELMRQFYDEKRSFRITSPNTDDGYEFVEFSNADIQDKAIGESFSGEQYFRHPVFDLKVKAQKRNPFSRAEQNMTAKELYQLGFFAPQKATEALVALDMMSFEGSDEVADKIRQNGDLAMQLEEAVSTIAKQQAMIDYLQGNGGQNQQNTQNTQNTQTSQGGGQMPMPMTTAESVQDGVMKSQAPMTKYGQQLASGAIPTVEG